ncbi:hypothetical protein TUM17377_39540 [Shewanella chilikensis]|nr:hypothetical protein TUM17377_39540 [Shewanella chilikensis]
MIVVWLRRQDKAANSGVTKTQASDVWDCLSGAKISGTVNKALPTAECKPAVAALVSWFELKLGEFFGVGQYALLQLGFRLHSGQV